MLSLHWVSELYYEVLFNSPNPLKKICSVKTSGSPKKNGVTQIPLQSARGKSDTEEGTERRFGCGRKRGKERARESEWIERERTHSLISSLLLEAKVKDERGVA